MAKPKFTDYVELIDTLFDKFTQARMHYSLNFFVCGTTSPYITFGGIRSLLSLSVISRKNNWSLKNCTIPIISKEPCIITNFSIRDTLNRRPHWQKGSEFREPKPV